MKANKSLSNIWRGIAAVLLISIFTTFGMSQNIIVSGSGSFSGGGLINVKGNINTSAASSAITFPGTVDLNGTTTQDIGVSDSKLVTFTTLLKSAASVATMTADVTATTYTQSAGTFAVSTKTLTFVGDPTKSSGTFDVSNATGKVYYNKASANQSTLAGTYVASLYLNGAATHNLAGDVSVGTFSHTGDALTVNNDLTITGTTSAFATIADVSALKTLTIGTGIATIAAITNNQGTISAVTNNGQINVTGNVTNAKDINSGSGGFAVGGTLSNSAGSAITMNDGALAVTSTTTNDGAMNFGSVASTIAGNVINQGVGTITGGSALVTFATLTQNGGIIAAGSGDINFGGTVTRTSGSIASTASANVLIFAGAVSGSGATIDLSTGGAAQFGSTIASNSGLNFPIGTTVTYNGSVAAQAIADVDYGNLTLTTNTKTWLLGGIRTINNNLDVQASSATTINGASNLNVTGNIALASDVTKSANAVVFENTSSAVSGTKEIIGSVTRTHTFAASAYTFNNADMVVTPTVTPGNITTFTMKSEPGINPTGWTSNNTINRKYTPSYTAGGTFTIDLKLSYLSVEASGVTEARLKQFKDGTINSGNKLAGTYTRIPAGGGFGYVSLAGLTNTAFTSGNEIALDDQFSSFASIAAANWNVASTWSDGVIPSSIDDVVIANNFAVTIPDGYAASALSTTIEATATGLTVGEGGSGTLAVGTGGLTNNNTGIGLTVAAGGAVTITLGNLTNNGAVTNGGMITVE